MIKDNYNKMYDLKYFSLYAIVAYYRESEKNRPFKVLKYELPLEKNKQLETGIGGLVISDLIKENDEYIGLVISNYVNLELKDKILVSPFQNVTITQNTRSDDTLVSRKILLQLRHNELYNEEVLNTFIPNKNKGGIMKKEDLKYYSLNISVAYHRGTDGDKPYRIEDYELSLEVGKKIMTDFGEFVIENYVEDEKTQEIVGVMVSNKGIKRFISFGSSLILGSINKDMTDYKKCLLEIKTNQLFYEEAKNDYNKVKHLVK